MKSPMNMAPNKMVSPAKKNIKDPSVKQKAAFDVNKDGNVTGAEMSSVFNMNSPAKMGSAYKMDKSAFKLKSAPVNMNTPGSVAKLAGVSPMKTKGLRKDLKDQGFKRTGESEVTKTLNAKELAEYKARNKK